MKPTTPSRDDAALLAEGHNCFDEGRIQAALVSLGRFVQANPGHAEARCLIGRCLARVGHGARAVSWLRQTLAHAPERIPVLLTIADVLLQERDVENARAVLERAAVEPGWSRAAIRLSVSHGCQAADAPRLLFDLLEARGDADRAADALALMADLAGNDPGIHLHVAVKLKARGAGAEALAHCRRAIELEPGLVDARLLAAEILDGTAEGVEAAAREFEAAAAAAPADPSLALAHFDFSLRRGRLGEAERVLRRGVQLGCGRQDVSGRSVALGQALERSGNAALAEDCYRLAFPEFVDGSSSVAATAAFQGATRRFGDLEGGLRVGRFNRLKEHLPLDLFFKGMTPPAGENGLYVSRLEADALPIDLSGRKVVLARCPRLPPRRDQVDSNMMPLAPIVLGNMLQARGAAVRICDLHGREAGPDDVGSNEVVARDAWEAFLDGHPSPRLEKWVDRLVARIDPAGADAVGLSVETAGAIPLALCLVRRIRAAFQVPVVLGGRGLEFPVPLLDKCPEAHVVREEGEIPLLLYVDAVSGRRPLATVPGLLWTENGRVRQNPPVVHDLDVRPRFDLSSMPLDGYDQGEVEEGSGPLVPYQFNQGCPFRCGFCNSFSRRVYRLRSPEAIVADLRHAAQEFGVNRFYMVNHLLNCNRTHLAELLDRLEAARLDLHWVDSARASGMTPETLVRLRRVGASRLYWGIDCASERLSRVMKKGMRFEEVVETLVAAHRVGISNVVNLILGMPHETDQDFEELLRLVERLHGHVARFQVARFQFFRISPMGRDPQAYGMLPAPGGGVVGPDGMRWDEGQAFGQKVEERMRKVQELLGSLLGGVSTPPSQRRG